MIRVGASGWSHEAWVGPVYPVSLRSTPDLWLRAYAKRLRTVELTSTFHASADEALVASWCREGVDLLQEGPFEFTLQMPREVTHDALPSGDVQRAWEAAARFERAVLDPIADEGLLGAVLLQLPSSFDPRPEHARALREVLAAVAGRHAALHFDDAEWLHSPHARDLLRDPDVCLVEDGRGASLPGAKHAYLRARAGASAGAGPGASAAGALAGRALAHKAMGRDVRVYFTDPREGRAVAEAVALLHELGEARHVPLPRLTAQTRLET